MKMRLGKPSTYPDHLKKHKKLLAKTHAQQQPNLTEKEAKKKQNQDMKEAAVDLVKKEHDAR